MASSAAAQVSTAESPGTPARRARPPRAPRLRSPTRVSRPRSGSRRTRRASTRTRAGGGARRRASRLAHSSALPSMQFAQRGNSPATLRRDRTAQTSQASVAGTYSTGAARSAQQHGVSAHSLSERHSARCHRARCSTRRAARIASAFSSFLGTFGAASTSVPRGGAGSLTSLSQHMVTSMERAVRHRVARRPSTVELSTVGVLAQCARCAHSSTRLSTRQRRAPSSASSRRPQRCVWSNSTAPRRRVMLTCTVAPRTELCFSASSGCGPAVRRSCTMS